MTYRDLLLNLTELTPAQLDQDVSIAIIDGSGVEVFPMCDMVAPSGQNANETQAYRDAVYLDEVNGGILDEGHPYMTVITQ